MAAWKSLAIALLLCVAAADAFAGDVHIISEKGRAFHPNEITVNRGDVVKILNDDEFTHHAHIDAPNFKWDAGEIDTGSSTEVTMDVSGTFEVRCAIHPKMRLIIKVK